MTQPTAQKQHSHIEPSKHSTDEVDEFLRHTEKHIDEAEGAGSPAIKPNPDLDGEGKPIFDKNGDAKEEKDKPKTTAP